MQIELPFNIGPTPPDIFYLFMTGEINIENSTQLCEKIKYMDQYNRLNKTNIPIELNINSPGGDLFASWMVCDVMNSVETPIITIAMGQVASGGIIVFMNGLKGYRIATPNTQFMSHRFLTAIEASHSELKNQQIEWDRSHERIINHYHVCTGLTKKVIEKDLLNEHNVWLTAEDCLKYKICDKIEDGRYQPDEVIKKHKKEKIK